MDIYVEQGSEGPDLPLSSLMCVCGASRRHAGPGLCRSRHVATCRGYGLEARDAAEADHRRSRLDFRLRPEADGQTYGRIQRCRLASSKN